MVFILSYTYLWLLVVWLIVLLFLWSMINIQFYMFSEYTDNKYNNQVDKSQVGKKVEHSWRSSCKVGCHDALYGMSDDSLPNHSLTKSLSQFKHMGTVLHTLNHSLNSTYAALHSLF